MLLTKLFDSLSYHVFSNSHTDITDITAEVSVGVPTLAVVVIIIMGTITTEWASGTPVSVLLLSIYFPAA
jgi:hypothetical protein